MVTINRLAKDVVPERSRVLFRRNDTIGRERSLRIVSRLAALSESQAGALAADLLESFRNRHLDLKAALLDCFDELHELLPSDRRVSEEHKLLIGAAFTQEYALEAAALFNPSIVPHPDQSNLSARALRFIMSLRATGEGHISSLVFRQGEISPNGKVTISPAGRLAVVGEINRNPSFDRELFRSNLAALGHLTPLTTDLLDRLDASFKRDELEALLDRVSRQNRYLPRESQKAIERARTLLQSHYEVRFSEKQALSERTIYPVAPTERGGIEDARFVCFSEEDGSRIYCATYTAYNGGVILPQIMITDDFTRFRISTLGGRQAENKGMALFPRRINGRYSMISRQDNENLYLMYSDQLLFWESRQLLLRPTFPWECVQIGNCGSPLETEAGWLLLIHGVGPMRRYTIGAVLLALDDPGQVIGRLPNPLLEPTENEREGYVPNVVYSCGALVHGKTLYLPYASSDYSTRFATIPLTELLAELQACGPYGTGRRTRATEKEDLD